ncbi:type III-B CRISPR module RAMP protein Cmr4 [Aquifex pyrophilus]
MKNTETSLLRVLTPLHIGTGQGTGYVDLPIYREVHTGFPAIPASSIKGNVRTEKIYEVAQKLKKKPDEVDRLVEKGEDESVRELSKLFGSKKNEGKAVFTDGRVLLFPVKSLRGIFALITSPYVINRFLKDIEKGEFRISLEDNSCIALSDTVKVDNSVVLEEFVFRCVRGAFPEELEKLPLEEEYKNRMVIVSDNVFSHMVRNYTEIQTHIKVNPETGTVSEGHLWTEEYVPSETVFYFQLINGENLLKGVNTLQLGGNTTTGKGVVEVLKL